MTEQAVEVEINGPVMRIWLNRPSASNAQNNAMLDGLNDCIRQASEDDDVRVVILAGRGKHFSAGHDLQELGEGYLELPTEVRYRYEATRYYGYAMAIRDLPKPVIAQVQGACIAAGFMLAGVCDMIVAAEDAYFSDPVVHFGAPGVELQVHPWVLGVRKARDLLFTGRKMGADEALRCDFVSRIVARDELDTATMDLAQQIAKAPPFSLYLTKRSLNRTEDIQGFRVASEATFDTHQLSHTYKSGFSSGGGMIQTMKSKVSEG